jgi:hypothetical protein
MKMTQKMRIVSAGFLLSTTLATPSMAWGGCNCAAIASYHNTTRNVVRAEHDQTREQVKTSIEQQTDDLRDHLDTKTQELIDALMGQARENTNYQQMQVEANQRIEDAAQVNATNRLRDEFRAEAESGKYDPNPFSCLLADLFGSSSSGGFTPGATGSAVSDNVADWVAGNNAVVQAGGTGLSKHVADKRDEFAGYGGSAHATTDWGLLLEEPTLDLSDPDMAEVASIIIRNGLDSTPDRAVTPEERLTPAGLDRIAQIEETSSRLGSASESIEMALNMRTSVMDGAPVETYREMAADSAYNRTITDKLSELQQIDIMTVWNYAPAGERLETLTNTGGMNEKAWMFELHRVLSLNARINYMQLELANRDAIVNANILATLNDND